MCSAVWLENTSLEIPTKPLEIKADSQSMNSVRRVRRWDGKGSCRNDEEHYVGSEDVPSQHRKQMIGDGHDEHKRMYNTYTSARRDDTGKLKHGIREMDVEHPWNVMERTGISEGKPRITWDWNLGKTW